MIHSNVIADINSDQKLISVIGKKGCGKTVSTFSLLVERYCLDKQAKILIYDPNDEYGELSNRLGTSIYEVPLEDVSFFNDCAHQIGRIIPNKLVSLSKSTQSILIAGIVATFNKGCLVLDNINAFGWLTPEIKYAICDHRKCDIIIHENSIDTLPIPIDEIDIIRLFHSYLPARKVYAKDYYELIHIAELIVDYYRTYDKYFYVDIDLKARQIRGDFNVNDLPDKIKNNQHHILLNDSSHQINYLAQHK